MEYARYTRSDEITVDRWRRCGRATTGTPPGGVAPVRYAEILQEGSVAWRRKQINRMWGRKRRYQARDTLLATQLPS